VLKRKTRNRSIRLINNLEIPPLFYIIISIKYESKTSHICLEENSEEIQESYDKISKD
jgi:hypothetical protein